MARSLKRFAQALALLCCAAATACSIDLPAKPLRKSDVPAGFTFANTRPVDVSVTAGGAALPRGRALLSIKRGDGGVIFEGPLLADQPLAAKLVVPTSDNQLTAVLHAPGASDQSATLAIRDGAASASF